MKKFGIIILMIFTVSDVAFARYGAHYAASACRPYNINSEFKWLTCNCQNEAGQESDAGQIMVTNVVMRRAQLGSKYGFKNSLAGVVTQDDQFSWIKEGPWSAPSPRCVANTQKALRESCIDSSTPDHYLNPKLASTNWSRALRRRGSFRVGNHEFFTAFRGVGSRACGARNLSSLYAVSDKRYTPAMSYRPTHRARRTSSDGGNNIFAILFGGNSIK
jgi:hypothetical protein